MNDSFDRLDVMRHQFPRVFGHAYLPWGLECGSGWDGLLVELLARLDTILTERPDSRFRIVQIKEKFGTLRFYVNFGEEGDEHTPADSSTTEVFAAITDAQRKSGKTCERCGGPSVIRNIGLVTTTVCPKCRGE